MSWPQSIFSSLIYFYVPHVAYALHCKIMKQERSEFLDVVQAS